MIRQAIGLLCLNVRPVQTPGPQIDRIIIAAEKILRVLIGSLNADQVFISQAVRIHQPVGIANIPVCEPAIHALEPSLRKASIGNLDHHFSPRIVHRSGLVPEQESSLAVFIDLDPGHAVHVKAVQGLIIIGAVAVRCPAVPVAVPVFLNDCLRSVALIAIALIRQRAVGSVRFYKYQCVASCLLKREHSVLVLIGIDRTAQIDGQLPVFPCDGTLVSIDCNHPGTVCGQLQSIQRIHLHRFQERVIEGFPFKSHLIELIASGFLRAGFLSAGAGQPDGLCVFMVVQIREVNRHIIGGIHQCDAELHFDRLTLPDVLL